MTILENRANFILWSLAHTASLIVTATFFQSIYQNVSSINGWGQYQTMLVLGIGTLIGGLGSMTFFTFMYAFEQKLVNGFFDFRLTKPASVLFQSAFGYIDVEDAVMIPSGLVIIIYALSRLPASNLFINVILFIPLIICSMLILFSFMTLLLSSGFKSIRMNAINNFFWSVVNLNKYPTKVISKTATIFSYTLAPIILISSVPAEVLFGRYDWPWIIASPIVTIVLFFTSRKVFYNALKDYSSASS